MENELTTSEDLSPITSRKVSDFFDAFVLAFPSFSGVRIAERYSTPYLAVQADGEARCYSSRAAIAEYFQAILVSYHEQGCRSCRCQQLQVVNVGAAAFLATVTWDLLREDQGVVTSWRESYILSEAGGSLLIQASIDHAQ